MREKTVKRFYCDHCSKGMFRKPDMIQHEMTCVANPARGCFLCSASSGTYNYAEIAAEMKKRPDVPECELDTDLFTVDSAEAIKWLYEKVDGCPTCALSVLKQGHIFAFGVFDYKKEVADWHREQNQHWRA